MLGVVLWSDPVNRKAVFWCEDQGDLAFYQAGHDIVEGDRFLDVGDMVTFATETQGQLRKAHHVTVIQENACTGLPEKLRDTSPRRADTRIDTRAGGTRILSFISPSGQARSGGDYRARKV